MHIEDFLYENGYREPSHALVIIVGLIVLYSLFGNIKEFLVWANSKIKKREGIKVLYALVIVGLSLGCLYFLCLGNVWGAILCFIVEFVCLAKASG